MAHASGDIGEQAVRLLIGEAARLLSLSPQRVRQLEKDGILRAERTLGGVRLFDAAQVYRLAAERAQRVQRG